MAARQTASDAVAGVVHDLQARLGSIRLAVTTIRDAEADAETREWMLDTAERETVRVSAELAGIDALVRCATTRGAATEIDLVSATRDAARAASRAGVDARVHGRGPVPIRGRARALDAVLTVLFRLAADGAGTLDVSVRAGPELRVSPGGDLASWPLVSHLAGGVGASVSSTEEGLVMRFGA